MDFLDPRKRRSHSIRLFIGYALMSIAIALGALILVYGAYGYGINTKTGDIIQNGLLFVDSQPGGADIYLDGKRQDSKTSARLILPAGDYSLTLKKEGYRDWEGKFSLNEHTVARYTYPLLLPLEPRTAELKVYQTTPSFMSQSPDQRWLLVQVPNTPGRVVFEEFDTANPGRAPRTLVLPESAEGTSANIGSRLQEIEWSSDNRSLLMESSYRTTKEFILFNREVPASSINVNREFDVMPTSVSLRDGKINQLYVLDGSPGNLRIADTARLTKNILLRNVLAFTARGANLITYVAFSSSTKGSVTANIWDGRASYPLHTFSSGSRYLLGMQQFEGRWYYVAGSNNEERLNLYADPLKNLQSTPAVRPVPLLSFNMKNTKNLSFSSNARFISAQSGRSLLVYDLLLQGFSRYTLKQEITGSLRWLDGYRLIGRGGGQVFVSDYGSANQQKIIPTLHRDGGFFSRDYKRLFATAPAEDNESTALIMADMRAGSDLPDSP